MIFVDTNIFMYAAGTDHINKIPSLKLLHDIAAKKTDACTNVEVLQEILHRYRSINRWEDGRKVYLLVSSIVPKICSIDKPIVDRCLELMDAYPAMTARDCLHVSFCLCREIVTICTYDKDFDGIKGIERIEPQRRI